jgi:hypothetical protein
MGSLYILPLVARRGFDFLQSDHVLEGNIAKHQPPAKDEMFYRGIGAPGEVQTLMVAQSATIKVFSADSGDCLQDCLASHDEGSRWKPLGSCSYALCLSCNQIILQNRPQAPRLETCGRVFDEALPRALSRAVGRPPPSVA